MPVLVNDPDLEPGLIAAREASGQADRDEMWEGLYVRSPVADIEHQDLASSLTHALKSILGSNALVFAGINVSHVLDEGWRQNFRIPDVAVYLPGNPARNCRTHWCGGPDFLVEILSPGDPSRLKLPFYAEVATREVLIIDRDPWALELYQLDQGVLRPAGKATAANAQALASCVLSLEFQLEGGRERPVLTIREKEGGRSWSV